MDAQPSLPVLPNHVARTKTFVSRTALRDLARFIENTKTDGDNDEDTIWLLYEGDELKTIKHLRNMRTILSNKRKKVKKPKLWKMLAEYEKINDKYFLLKLSRRTGYKAVETELDRLFNEEV